MVQTKGLLLTIKKYIPEIFSLECPKICFILGKMIIRKNLNYQSNFIIKNI